MTDVFLGVSSQRPSNGVRLHDGGAAVFREGYGFYSLAEERLSRRKHDDGYSRAVPVLLRQVNADSTTRIHLGFSSALDAVWTPQAAREQFVALTGLEPASIAVFDHHLAHAASAMATEPDVDGTAFVVDARGNEHARGGFQCESSMPVRAGSLIPEMRAEPALNITMGWGQLWRAVTKAIGFPSYHDASKTMALAGVARGQGLEPLWNPADHGLAYRLAADLVVENPVGSLLAAVRRRTGMQLVLEHDWLARDDGRRSSDIRLLVDNLRLALTVQASYELWLEGWVRRECGEPSSAGAVFLSGGVSANCVAAGRLAELGYDVRVAAAPGDDGQALGNLQLLLKASGIEESPHSAFLGPDVRPLPPHVERIDSDRACDQLAAGSTIAAVRGGSELGPRALGHRSILGGPTTSVLDQLRTTKRRESFQPFGVVVPAEWADSREIARSPYMSLASTHPDFPDTVRHDDGTIRYQTVDRATDAELHSLLTEAERVWGWPLLVNTSLNGRGEPLVSGFGDFLASSAASSAGAVWADPA